MTGLEEWVAQVGRRAAVHVAAVRGAARAAVRAPGGALVSRDLAESFLRQAANARSDAARAADRSTRAILTARALTFYDCAAEAAGMPLDWPTSAEWMDGMDPPAQLALVSQ